MVYTSYFRFAINYTLALAQSLGNTLLHGIHSMMVHSQLQCSVFQ